MGRRTNLRLAQSKPPLGQGFRGFDRQRQNLGLHRLRTAVHQEISLPIEQPMLIRLSPKRTTFRSKPMKGSESPNANGSWSIEAIHAWVRAVEARDRVELVIS